jgi:hypothetical protein
MTPFEVVAHIEVCQFLNLNPILNHVILLDDQIYITLEGHLQNAHQSKELESLETIRKETTKVKVQVNEWTEPSNPG